MTRICERYSEPITFLDAQTTSGNSAWHTRCWNQAAEERAAYIAECEDRQKSSDLSDIPLCTRHHRTGDDWYHKRGPLRFAEVHQVDIAAIAARLSAKPFIRVEWGVFVGRFGEEEYALGSTEAGFGSGDSQDEPTAA